jgi:hypothetical protein
MANGDEPYGGVRDASRQNAQHTGTRVERVEGERDLQNWTLPWGLHIPRSIPCRSPVETCDEHREHPPVIQRYPSADCEQV